MNTESKKLITKTRFNHEQKDCIYVLYKINERITMPTALRVRWGEAAKLACNWLGCKSLRSVLHVACSRLASFRPSVQLETDRPGNEASSRLDLATEEVDWKPRPFL